MAATSASINCFSSANILWRLLNFIRSDISLKLASSFSCWEWNFKTKLNIAMMERWCYNIVIMQDDVIGLGDHAQHTFSCCSNLIFCSCISSNAWAIESISAIRAWASCFLLFTSFWSCLLSERRMKTREICNRNDLLLCWTHTFS